MSTALARWRHQLEARRIPDRILKAAPESPYGFPPELFRRRAAAITRSGETTPTIARALEALPPGGTVLDVGVGGGATSLPLASETNTAGTNAAGLIVGVDAQQDMLDAFGAAAAEMRVAAQTVCGVWPEVAAQTPGTDVVVCGHVLYNVRELEPFAVALDRHAGRRVVVEITREHPIAWMDGLWRSFHGVEWPRGPTAEDAQEALHDLGFDIRREDRNASGDRGGGFPRREDAVALIRRRLCLAPDRDDEVSEALGDLLRVEGGLWSSGPAERVVVTLWWDRLSSSGS
jgi:2-polyprenyl-3-methyl-5-hydroxy-6-metoxy-1,4-benzoquinol methylase